MLHHTMLTLVALVLASSSIAEQNQIRTQTPEAYSDVLISGPLFDVYKDHQQLNIKEPLRNFRNNDQSLPLVMNQFRSPSSHASLKFPPQGIEESEIVEERESGATAEPDSIEVTPFTTETSSLSEVILPAHDDSTLVSQLVSRSKRALLPELITRTRQSEMWPEYPTISASKRDVEDLPETGLNSQQNLQGESALSAEQRSGRCSMPEVVVGEEELPWTCGQRFTWRHLGQNFYPSLLYEVLCEGRTCWYGHFNCTAITYTVHVLELCSHGCQDHRVPHQLRSRWQWTSVNVTVGCQCVR